MVDLKVGQRWYSFPKSKRVNRADCNLIEVLELKSSNSAMCKIITSAMAPQLVGSTYLYWNIPTASDENDWFEYLPGQESPGNGNPFGLDTWVTLYPRSMLI